MTPQAREPQSFRLLATLAKEADFGDPEAAECGRMSSPVKEQFLFPSMGSSEQIGKALSDAMNVDVLSHVVGKSQIPSFLSSG